MDFRLRIIIIVGSILVLVGIINMVRRENLDLKYVLSWILIDVAVMIMGIYPKIIEVIANIMGIGLPMNALFFIGMLFTLIIVYSLTVAQSRNSKKVKKLAQKIALYEYELMDKEKESKN